MKNQEVARIFRDTATMLELKGENPFRIRAYERAAQNIESLTDAIESYVAAGTLTTIAGIGKDLAAKIKEIIETGKLTYYQELKKEVPKGLVAMLEIPGLGPKTVKAIYDALKIDSVEKLEVAAKSGKLANIEGIREKTQENILKGIALVKQANMRIPLAFAASIADSFVEELKKNKYTGSIEVAGSLRRLKDTVRDVDILVTSEEPAKVMDTFVKNPLVERILAHGETKSSVIAGENNIQVDLRVVSKENFGSALMYFTGSKEFNIRMRSLALKRDCKISEYGVFKTSGKEEKWVAGKQEKDIFSFFNMEYITPELREDRGEIEAALKHELPHLLELKDIKGDFHVHSRYSDGTAQISEIAFAVQKRGYQYVGVCDHSRSLKIANGLSIKEVHQKKEEIQKINEKSNTRLLLGTEVEIDSQGKLDYPASVLKEFDLVVAAIHSGFKQSKAQLTRRMVKACENKYVNIIAHPTGKLWGVREAYDIDLDEVFKVAADCRVAMEINCHPQRVDLNDINAMRAKKNGVKISLGTDSHILDQLSIMELGVSTARRSWLTKEDVLNCMNLEELLKWLKKQ
ncbi:MAG: DNA polymerase/3'-5' exonuclease PolX [Candidatus Omnitrophica bacterium]|nr:DNA polymerase/3'-5' exonuclease PolX [Candidatus Omnitrophota bacterium]